ncbi:ABC transporter substrate-binding protein [Sporosarcina sp. 179-K 3D1 HS]|uniref:ABC transporter substrate-binding protein n=1 Tax=Sporosarcina sp. 179-K 3D1 HS TaxID=3232169 RepID=UPI0039A3C1BE
MFLLLLGACTSNSNETTQSNPTGEEETSQPKQGGEILIAYEADASSFDPIKANNTINHPLLSPIYDTLITYTTGLEPRPGLAESWEIVDEKTIVLSLRENVVFHDGTPFNAEAVKFNIERVNSEESLVTDLKSIESVEVLDEFKVQLNLATPDSSLILALADVGGMMASPKALQESGEDFSQHPIGAGPFRFVSRVPNGEIVYEANKEYWQEGKPYLDKMTIKVMADENTRINALKSGEVDYVEYISQANIQNVSADSSIKLSEIMPLRFEGMLLNSALPPFDEKAVRLAVLHGIDREGLINALNFGKGEPATQLFPKDYWAADPDLKIAYDPEKSKQLLKDAGLDQVSFELVHYTTAFEQRLAEAIKSQLSEVGIQVDLQPMEAQAAIASFSKEKQPILLTRWNGRPDPLMSIKALFSKDGYYNKGKKSTDEIENLINLSAATYEQAELAKLYGEINEKALLGEGMVIPLFFSPRVSAMKNTVHGYEPNKQGKPIYTTIWRSE